MITFLINELNICGGTHKQFLHLVKYINNKHINFQIITTNYNREKTYPEFKQFENRIHVIQKKQDRNVLYRIYDKLIFALRLRRAIKGSTIINVHDPGFELFFPIFPAKSVIWQINDLPSYFHVGVFKTGRHNKIKSQIAKRLAIWGTHHAVRQITVNVTKNKKRVEHVLKQPASVFYCGIEPIGIYRDQKATKDRFEHNEINILTSGVFFPYRNYETQILVIEHLIKTGIHANLKIIGATSDQEYTAKIRQMIIDKKLESHVQICGQVNERLFSQLHHESDVFMFINIDQSWGLSVFEAMSCNIPVIVSSSVGATEILKDKFNAIFVNPTDIDAITEEIKRLMTDPSYYNLIVMNAKEIIHQYTWDNSYCAPITNLLLS